MNNLLLTGSTGEEHNIMASHTIPLMKKYANIHSLDFLAVDLYHPDIPASWMKVYHLINQLPKYNKILWMDCDIIIQKFDENIFDELTDPYVQCLVEHHVNVGDVPNCGLWLVNQQMIGVLEYIWNNKDTYLYHPWWEQAAMLKELGYTVLFIDGGYTRSVQNTLLKNHTKFIDPKWNHHPGDSAKSNDPNFMHITGYADRLGKIKELTSV